MSAGLLSVRGGCLLVSLINQTHARDAPHLRYSRRSTPMRRGENHPNDAAGFSSSNIVVGLALFATMALLSFKLCSDHNIIDVVVGGGDGNDTAGTTGTTGAIARVDTSGAAPRGTTHFTHLIDLNPPGIWGPPTATIDWCEENYATTVYVAEWWNTISNVGIVLSGCWGVCWCLRQRHERRFVVLAILITLIGLGSAAYHGTLLFHMQMLDELPMVYVMTAWLYIWYEIDRPRPRPWLAPALVASLLVVSAGHLYYGFVVLFQMFFAGQTFLGMYHVWLAVTAPTADRTLKIIAFLYAFSIGGGVSIWLLEQNLCTELRQSGYNPQLHAIWHVVVGFNCLVCVPLVCYARGLGLRKDPRLFFHGVRLLPFAKAASLLPVVAYGGGAI